MTADALDFALSALKIKDATLRQRLMNSYLILAAYPEVPQTLRQLKSSGMKLAILSNGTPAMLASASADAGITATLDAILSVEQIGIYKPHPFVYRLPCQHFNLLADRICFISSNGWDAYSAKAFGFRALWCNRFDQAPEHIPESRDAPVATLAQAPGIVLA